MIKKIFFFVLLVEFVFAKVLEKPPMPPINLLQQKDSKSSCELIPPMLYRLPPPLLEMVDKCNNETLKPKLKDIKKVLKKLDIEASDISIEYAKDMPRMYKIKYKKRDFRSKGSKVDKSEVIYCNWKLSKCFLTSPVDILNSKN